jgi:hypothetical protein
MERGQFVFKADKLTTVNIDKKNVATLVTPLNILRLDMIDGKVYYGHFEALPNHGSAFFRTNATDSTMEGGRVMNLLEIETIKIDNPNFFQNVQGDLNFGLSYNRSSSILRTNVSNNLAYTIHRITLGQTSNGINTLNDSAAAWERFNASVFAVYKMKNKWRAATVFAYQRMLELGITSRIINTEIIGYPILNNRRLSLLALSGISLSREYRTDNTVSNLQFEIPFQLRFDLYKMSNSDFTVSSTTTLYKGITISDRIRIDHSTDLSLKVYKDLKVSLEFFVNYDSNPSAKDVSNADYGTVIGLGYNF